MCFEAASKLLNFLLLISLELFAFASIYALLSQQVCKFFEAKDTPFEVSVSFNTSHKVLHLIRCVANILSIACLKNLCKEHVIHPHTKCKRFVITVSYNCVSSSGQMIKKYLFFLFLMIYELYICPNPFLFYLL